MEASGKKKNKTLVFLAFYRRTLLTTRECHIYEIEEYFYCGLLKYGYLLYMTQI